MKRHILQVVRRTGLLRQADAVMLWRGRARSYLRNRRFAAEHPEFAMPPDELAFDAYDHVARMHYYETARQHAALFAAAIAEALPQRELAILEWGCGPGRIIRHIAAGPPGRQVRLAGTDVNEASIAWSARHLPGIDFRPNGFSPPLPFADSAFDVVYCFSVFTHLSDAAQQAWAGELHRVLRPGGVLLCTTQGDVFRDRLAVGEERRRYEEGGLVVQDGYQEGKKWFLALNSPTHVRTRLLAAFCDVRHLLVPPEAQLQPGFPR